jgi:hypothetical protein
MGISRRTFLSLLPASLTFPFLTPEEKKKPGEMPIQIPPLLIGRYPTPIFRLTKWEASTLLSPVWIKLEGTNHSRISGIYLRILDSFLSLKGKGDTIFRKKFFILAPLGSYFVPAVAEIVREKGGECEIFYYPEPIRYDQSVALRWALKRYPSSKLKNSFFSASSAFLFGIKNVPEEDRVILPWEGFGLSGALAGFLGWKEIYESVQSKELPPPDTIYISTPRGEIGGGIFAGKTLYPLPSEVVLITTASPFQRWLSLLSGERLLKLLSPGTFLPKTTLQKQKIRWERFSPEDPEIFSLARQHKIHMETQEGIPLELPYTASAFAILVKEKVEKRTSQTLFWHTGNTKTLSDLPPYESLPPPFKTYLKKEYPDWFPLPKQEGAYGG